jgi:hypothetical protein
MNRASLARSGSVRPIAEIRQSNDRADQQENHDELGIFNQQGNHGAHSNYYGDRQEKNISPFVARV